MPRTIPCLLSLLLVFPALAQDHWSHWRGPTSDGHSADTRVPLTWSETDNVLWKTKLPGVGASSPVVWSDRAFLTASSADAKERYVLCVRVADGKLLWQQTAAKDVEPERTNSWNGYATPSCATDGKHVYAFFGTPGLFCYDSDGNFVWKHSFGVFTSEAGWGIAASPFLYKDLVIQNCDNDGPAGLKGGNPRETAPQALLAFDKLTGKVRWSTPRNQGRGFSTPRLVTNPSGRIDLVLNGPHGVWGYDPQSGKEVWHCNRRDPSDAHRFGEPIPVTDGKLLFAPSGRPGPFQAVKLDGTGDVTKSHLLWEVKRTKHRDCSSQILFDGLLYAADSKGMLTVYDPQTGKALYDDYLAPRKKSLASPLALRGKLLFLMDDGETFVIEPGKTPKVLHSNKLGNKKDLEFVASPAVVAGKLLIRSQSFLYCIGEKK